MNLKEINAFALPGGPMFVHRGMFDAAASEGEVVGVMAHELSHVLLRHGTANATKAQNPWLQLGQIAGAVGGAVVGGAAGSAIAQGSQFGLGTCSCDTAATSRSRRTCSARRSWRAPATTRARSRTCSRRSSAKSKSGGGSGPQWMSSHPNPGNRTEYITKEAELLTIASPADTSEFEPIKTAFAALPAGEVDERSGARRRARSGGESRSGGRNAGTARAAAVVAVSRRQRRQRLPGVGAVQLDQRCRRTARSRSSRKTATASCKGETVFSHGVEFGVAKAASRDLQDATNAWLKAVAQNNPELRVAGTQQNDADFRSVRRSARRSSILPRSAARSSIGVYTTFLADGTPVLLPDRRAGERR